MHILGWPFLFLLFSSLVLTAPPCRFAHLFQTEDLLNSPTVQQRYLEYVANWENGFHQPGIGYSLASGYTFDGHGLDYETGDIAPPLHNFSAPSKEAMHVAMLALAVNGNKIAQIFVDPSGSANAVNLTVKLLEKKINTYENWNKKFPGYGGYMPWVSVSNTNPELKPVADWYDRVPSLDNGEWVWSIYAASITLSKNYTSLAQRYRNYFDMLANNSVTIFYDGDGKVRAEAKIFNIYAQPTPNNYENNVPGYFLDDPYEGELFVWMLDLFGTWDNPADREKIWDIKAKKLQSVDYTSPVNGSKITVQRGFWFSSHEQWKYLELPYLDVPLHQKLFKNCERARVRYSADNNIPGLYASVSNWTTGGPVAQYFSAVGIPEIAFNPSITRDLLTPYGSMMLMLTELGVGLAWHHNMLLMPRMQGPHGTTESMSKDGVWISPVVTWDSKITTLLAMSGGIGPVNREGLQKDEKYQRFVNVLTQRWSQFENLKGEELPFSLPPLAEPPKNVPDFTMCEIQK